MIRGTSATPFVGALLIHVLAVGLAACGHAAEPPHEPVPLPAPRTALSGVPEPEPPVASLDAGATNAKLDASSSAASAASSASSGSTDGGPQASADAGTIRNGPVLDDADAVARATQVANGALDKAYAQFVKKAQVAPSHSGPWVRAASVVKGNLKAGWDVTFSQTPPAGFSHEALIHVSPRGEVTVKKAEAGFSPD